MSDCEVCGKPRYVEDGCWRGGANGPGGKTAMVDEADCYRRGYAALLAENERVKAWDRGNNAQIRSMGEELAPLRARCEAATARDAQEGP